MNLISVNAALKSRFKCLKILDNLNTLWHNHRPFIVKICNLIFSSYVWIFTAENLRCNLSVVWETLHENQMLVAMFWKWVIGKASNDILQIWPILQGTHINFEACLVGWKFKTSIWIWKFAIAYKIHTEYTFQLWFSSQKVHRTCSVLRRFIGLVYLFYFLNSSNIFFFTFRLFLLQVWKVLFWWSASNILALTS